MPATSPRQPSARRLAATGLAALAGVLAAAAPTASAAAGGAPRAELRSPSIVAAVKGEPRTREAASRPRARSSVVGGYSAPRGYWPWLAELSRPDQGGRHWCGGTLVNPHVVLTAAHCVEGLRANQLQVSMGRHLLSEAPAESLAVAEIASHPNYDARQVRSDVALLRLARPSAQRVAPLMSTAYTLQAGTVATALGWGATQEGGQGSNALKGVNLPLLGYTSCQQRYPYPFLPAGYRSPVPAFDASTQMCAGFDDGVHSTCQGDSGGPLMVRDTAGGWLLVGAVSWAYGCARASFPTVFAWLNAPTIRPWIDANTAALAARAAAGGSGGGGTGDGGAGAGGGGGTGGDGHVDVAAPHVSGMRLAPRRFRGARGTTVRFSLSEAATVTLAVVRASGRNVVRPIQVRGAAGANGVRITLRRVRRGRYFLAVRATDAAGNASGWKHVAFRIKR